MPEAENISDWRGKEIVDRDGDKLGKLQDVYVDTTTDEPVFGSVKEGLISKHLTFVPLADATTSPDGLKVTVTKKQVTEAENIDQDGELTAGQESDLYRHYGIDYTPADTDSGRRLAKR